MLSWQALLQKRALLTRSVDDQIQAANAQEPLRKCLGSLDLLLLGLGSILGTGAFVLTGVAAREHAGYQSGRTLFFKLLAFLATSSLLHGHISP